MSRVVEGVKEWSAGSTVWAGGTAFRYVGECLSRCVHLTPSWLGGRISRTEMTCLWTGSFSFPTQLLAHNTPSGKPSVPPHFPTCPARIAAGLYCAILSMSRGGYIRMCVRRARS